MPAATTEPVGMSSAPSPIDWDRAEKVALAVAARRRTSGVPAGHVEPEFTLAPTEAVEQAIEAVTGLRPAHGTASVQFVDRPTWIRANLASFRALLAPLVEQWGERAASSPTAANLGRQVAGAEVGALLGWMSTRVLGQYDILVGRQADDDAVYLVAPNLGDIERRYGFDPGEFRTWVLLHELTHRAQFTGVPWMRQHFTGLVDQSLSFANPDLNVFMDALKVALRNRRDASAQVRDGGVFGLLAQPEQRAVMTQVSGLMSLLEGHGDVTMTRAAGGLVPNAGAIRAHPARATAHGEPAQSHGACGWPGSKRRSISTPQARGSSPPSRRRTARGRSTCAGGAPTTCRRSTRCACRPPGSPAWGASLTDPPPVHPVVAAALTRCTFPAVGTEVTCAVSGGADSAALLVLGTAAGLRIAVVHVDHRLRPDSHLEAEFVRGLAARFGASFRSATVAVGDGPNLEARARAARYAALPHDVLTGHTADDQAETVLVNLLRGAASSGLARCDPARVGPCSRCAAPTPKRFATPSAFTPCSIPPTPTLATCATGSATSCCR